MGEIKHFSHEHGLTPCSDLACSGNCHGCMRRISGPAYRCSKDCNFFIHQWCAELPRAITHPLHPRHTLVLHTKTHKRRRCHACGCYSHGFFLCCCIPDCQFRLDAICAWLTPKKDQEDRHEHKINCISPTSQSLIQTHLLILCDMSKNFDLLCCACKLPFQDSIYVCLVCKLLLHKTCFEFPLEIFKHPFHPQHTLTLHSREGRHVHTCRACGHRQMQFFYRCVDCPFKLDIVCASLTLTTNSEGHKHRIQHMGRNHRLIICDMKYKFNPSCSVCLLPFQDSTIYVCLKCRILLHKSCFELPRKIKHHPFWPKYNFRLDQPFLKESVDCEACEESIDYGCSYSSEYCDCEYCDNKPGFFGTIFRFFESSVYIHAKCGLLKPTIMSNLHDHPLAFIKKKGSFGNSKCRICDRYIDTAFLRCETSCDYSIHVRCYPALPNTIKVQYHLHPLAITNSPVKDFPDEDENAELYCDACEERRYLLHPTYYCAECHFVAHVDCDCVVSEVVRVLEEEWSNTRKPGDTESDTSTGVVEDTKSDTSTDDDVVEDTNSAEMERSEMDSEGEDTDVFEEHDFDFDTDSSRAELERTELDSASEDDLVRDTENLGFVELNEEIAMLRQKVVREIGSSALVKLNEEIEAVRAKVEAQKAQLQIVLQHTEALEKESSKLLYSLPTENG
ncbi:uncharacterized protein LOC132284796 [Cornus florida]|uniref:uncharacterized protein LOC132284796 n=1 Tax=Cornus florida TaxID=4283 RepID=UPI00289E6CA7|nr:uncharacterized protein LOC132284796 [Cornus florida]